MRILAIGDTHGRTKWELLQKEDADKIIFIGDYFDNYYITQVEQIKNFENILNWKIKEPNKVELLFGNHDYHYLVNGKVQYSGYKANPLISQLINDAVKADYLKVFYINNNYLFSHAGISNTFLNYLEKDGFQMSDLNEILKVKNKILDYGHYGYPMSEYGDDPEQGPLWIRPNSLRMDLIENYTQVVGHSVQQNIKIENQLILIDVPNTDEVLEIIDDKPQIYHL